jgi:hypothetical protein
MTRAALAESQAGTFQAGMSQQGRPIAVRPAGLQGEHRVAHLAVRPAVLALVLALAALA